MDDYDKLSHSVWDCKYHVVFIPKYRKKSLYGELRRQMSDMFRTLAAQKGSSGAARMPIRRTAAALFAVATVVSCGGGGAGAPPTVSTAASLKGTITSLGTRGRIAGASVQVTDGSNAGKMAVTDTTGQYQLDGLSPGGASVKITAPFFEDQTVSVTVAGSTVLDTKLRRLACEGAGASCGLEPTTSNETMPMFQPPFVGDLVASNLMDHNVPLQFQDNNGSFVSYCGGGNGRGGIEGHSGYDWLLPRGLQS